MISSSYYRDEASLMRVTVMPVSTYVAQPKEENAGSAWVYPNQPPFASHWAIVVGDIGKGIALSFDVEGIWYRA
jgi:hypothetical protein